MEEERKQTSLKLHGADKVNRKAVKKGLNFTILVVGESGLGKSTLIANMFSRGDSAAAAANFSTAARMQPSALERISRTTTIARQQFELDEKSGGKLRLTVVDTPGFYDAIDASNCCVPIEEVINDAFDQYFKRECDIIRVDMPDNRVHCCLYFISPFGRGLRAIDVELMRRLHRKVNLVPVIGKADALTASELISFKQRILSDLEKYKIEIYNPPDCDSDEDESFKQQDAELKKRIPFAVIGGNSQFDINGKSVRVREYPWGVVDIENTKFSDFTYLRLFLLKTHMQDLKDMTKDVHYENYRANFIKECMSKQQQQQQLQQQKCSETSSSVNSNTITCDTNATIITNY